jgi:hypothetical protein
MIPAIAALLFLLAWFALASHLLGRSTPSASSADPSALAAVTAARLADRDMVAGPGTADLETSATIPTTTA